MNRPRLLITGAGGFCGEHACAYFAGRGYAVTGVLRSRPELQGTTVAHDSAASMMSSGTSPSADEEDSSVQYAWCDLTMKNDIEALVMAAKPDYVLHFAGMNAVGPSWTDPAAALESNLMGTVRLLEAIRKESGEGGACRIVIAGSMLRFNLPADGSPPSPPHPYSFSKTLQVLAARSWVPLYGMDVIIAEPSNLIGPGRSKGICTLMAEYAAKAELAAEQGRNAAAPFKLSSRTEVRDVIDVRDAIRAYELLLQQGVSGEVYPLASGRMRTLGELADTVTSLARTPLAWEVGQSAASSPAPADVSKLARLGWSPAIPLVQSLTDTLEQMRLKVREA
ncbi:GDP-4-dehydro-6-deoxy-D-mannose reductase [Paenibacillus phyllosphaerae]|uniref:GDP-4-dehydro-6-deoxy-D-mannose reductase n=1 Tax=Paenibacillus phyllosphaerae TaxID=274593 RepID=A0A7W5FQV5_9BACL|nr:NAD-dependent epimerase/dehydratase family protein [Paenibacillus phyllosphaerae]MBB3113622.1 GDP-4-dehydro-6-deoxy-D-mannose reductase [Paenibacillus phyllosphaerae]